MKLNNCYYLQSPEEKQPLPSSTLPTLLTKGSENLIYVFIFLVKTHDIRENETTKKTRPNWFKSVHFASGASKSINVNLSDDSIPK